LVASETRSDGRSRISREQNVLAASLNP
jgi:hypothetical protein